MRSKIHDGQLDECPLTLAELAIVKESFANTLRSMLHNRISYPKEEEKASSQRRDPNDPESSRSSRGARAVEAAERPPEGNPSAQALRITRTHLATG